MGYIYVIRNIDTNMVYVGKTNRSISIRWTEHNNNKHRLLSEDIKKYGKEKFMFISIQEVPQENLDNKELEVISEYNCVYPNGYNIQNTYCWNTEANSKGGKSDIGHDKQSIVMKERYKNLDNLKCLGDVPRGISYYKCIKKGCELEGFKVRKVGVKSKEFASSVKKNNLEYNLQRSKNYLIQCLENNE